MVVKAPEGPTSAGFRWIWPDYKNDLVCPMENHGGPLGTRVSLETLAAPMPKLDIVSSAHATSKISASPTNLGFDTSKD